MMSSSAWVARSVTAAWLMLAGAAPSPLLAAPFLPEMQCADGLDDDRDGFTDCADPDCAASAACAAQDYDGDGVANALDCAPLDAGATSPPPDVPLLRVARAPGTDAQVTWDAVAPSAGSGTVYDLLTGRISALWADRGLRSASLLVRGSLAPSATDARLTGVAHDGWWYLVRTRNACGPSDAGNALLDADPPYDESPTNCTDTADDDGDGLADCDDPDCTGDASCVEDCGNGIDDDADARVDCDDEECIGLCPEAGACADGTDNDADGRTDCADPDCNGDPACCASCGSETAALIAPGVTCRLVAGVVGTCPAQYYSFLATAGECYTFSTCSCGGTASFDAVLRLFGPACNPAGAIARACSGGGTSLVRWRATFTGRAVVEVSSATGASGSFLLAYSTCTEEGSCANGADDDGDGLVDCADAQCTDDPNCPELCAGGIDDDADGLVDCADPECIGDPACPESSACADGIDNDGDTLVDCADPECAASVECRPCPGCPNGDPIAPPLDSWQTVAGLTTSRCPAAHYLVDVVPGLCYQFSLCSPEGRARFDSILTASSLPSCTQIAFNDDSCGTGSFLGAVTPPAGVTQLVVKVTNWGSPSPLSFDLAYRKCPIPEGPANCADGVDNDGDTLIDCADVGCRGSIDCPEAGHCADGVDNDGDGASDCADADCSGDVACPEAGNCVDGVDNDLDGDADCADADCASDVACCPSCGAPGAALPNATTTFQTLAGDTTATCNAAWYAVTLVAGSLYEFMTCPPGLASADARISLFLPACGFPTAADDDTCGTDPRLTYTAPVTGLFKLAVDSAGGGPMSFVLAWRRCGAEGTAGTCDNVVDDDSDGALDCADPDCAFTPPC